jgi:hypothetical protein
VSAHRFAMYCKIYKNLTGIPFVVPEFL